MPNKAPLTIENFEIDKLRAKAFESKKSEEFTYFVIPFDYDGEDSLIKVEGNFRVFKYVNNGRVNYSLAIGINPISTGGGGVFSTPCPVNGSELHNGTS